MTSSNDTTRPLAQPLTGEPKEAGSIQSPDVSARIVAALERQQGDIVRCTRIGGNYYRCNWWAANTVIGDDPGASAPSFTTHRIRKSQFLEATITPKGLLLRVHSDAGLGVRTAAVAVAPSTVP